EQKYATSPLDGHISVDLRGGKTVRKKNCGTECYTISYNQHSSH
ncbi:hypothetical protein MIMGU_mgv1a0224741mg, partial [Erythranthe guttata]